MLEQDVQFMSCVVVKALREYDFQSQTKTTSESDNPIPSKVSKPMSADSLSQSQSQSQSQPHSHPLVEIQTANQAQAQAQLTSLKDEITSLKLNLAKKGKFKYMWWSTLFICELSTEIKRRSLCCRAISFKGRDSDSERERNGPSKHEPIKRRHCIFLQHIYGCGNGQSC
jgi:hypothetical protein